jgi:hypothetical protein
MGIVASLNRLDKTYAWSLLGFVLAAILGALTIYTEFLRNRGPLLDFEVVSDASVLDVREQLGNLDIIYDGVDIKKAKESLRVIVMRVANKGPGDILKASYDEKSPLGLHVINGTLLRAEVLGTSNDYLHNTLQVQLHAPDTALFEPVIRKRLAKSPLSTPGLMERYA